MREFSKDRIAEWILSLAVPMDRAAGMVGDLMEEFGGHRFQFWVYVIRTELAYVLRELIAQPLQLIFGASLAWLGYLLVGGFFAFVAYLVLIPAWGMVYFFGHHSGLELVADFMKFRLDWFPPPDWVFHGIAALIKWIVVPFHMGRSLAKRSPGRELVSLVAMLIVWPLIAKVTKTPLSDIPLIQMTVLIGVLWQRWITTRPTAR